MATFFGEIVERSSRAFWDGYEEVGADLADDIKPVFTLQILEKSENDSYQYFIVATDSISTGFVTACFALENAKLIANIEKVENVAGIETTKHTSIAEIHKLNNNTLLLKCVSDIDTIHANELLNIVTPWVKRSNEITILLSQPIEEYKTFNPKTIPKSSFCRSLKTSNYKTNVQSQHLACPNAIAGFPAAVLSWCEVNKQAAVMFTYYYTNGLPLSTSINIEPLMKFCQPFLWYKQIEKAGVKSKTVSIKSNVFGNSNLYM